MSVPRLRQNYHVIVLPEEDDVDGNDLSNIEQGLRRLHRARDTGQNIPIIDLTEVEEEQRNVARLESDILQDLDEEEGPSFRGQTPESSRNLPIPWNLQMSSCRFNGKLIKKGTVVEVAQRPRGEYSWQFLEVYQIHTDIQSGDVILRGIRLTRQRYLRGLLPRTRNEVWALYDINKQDKRPEHIQAAVEISAKEVIRSRALFRTNDAYPKHRFNRWQFKDNADIEKNGALVQRWKFLKFWTTLKAMANGKSYGGAVVRLQSADIQDNGLKVTDEKLRNEFRGGINRGGSFKDGHNNIPIVELDDAIDLAQSVLVEGNQQYTADDMFCGAGGASCGQRRAGFRLRLACDHEMAACASYRENFPEANLQQMNIFDLIKNLEDSTDHSDLLHISPPCQVWSPAHTRSGKNDSANVAALFACAKILERRRPRICTGEQTFGLLFDRNQEFFNALVGQYTALGYSFSWDILPFKDYGVPSIRRRLIWIASCLGEALPPFPAPTHTGKSGLPPPVTLRDALRSVKSRDSLHNIEDMLHRARNNPRFPKEQYDDRIQIRTVTTSGSELGHPSGRRNFTARELACIQGFPNSHKFCGTSTEINRQIGNAFPPVVVEIMYNHLRNWLMQQDRVVLANKKHDNGNRRPEDSQRQGVIVIDDDEEELITIAKPANSRELILIEDTDDDYNPDGDQGTATTHYEESAGKRVGNAIVITDDSDNQDVIIVDDEDEEDGHNFSGLTSRTLSFENLHASMDIDINGDYDAETGRSARLYMERQLQDILASRRMRSARRN
ncbi:S-adenosyl-L-methionine-dependent methyltransferase [Xylariaceae sp. FL1651]|nr:S-adenosyl-L-methionine-dependent methyltransferase [Xylariaceae sp. FL1651]